MLQHCRYFATTSTTKLKLHPLSSSLLNRVQNYFDSKDADAILNNMIRNEKPASNGNGGENYMRQPPPETELHKWNRNFCSIWLEQKSGIPQKVACLSGKMQSRTVHPLAFKQDWSNRKFCLNGKHPRCLSITCNHIELN